jgi:hypothetical protein
MDEIASISPPSAGSDVPTANRHGRHPSIFDPATLILLTMLCIFGAIIGMQLLVTLGVTANTFIVGALMLLGGGAIVGIAGSPGYSHVGLRRRLYRQHVGLGDVRDRVAAPRLFAETVCRPVARRRLR